MRILDKLNKYNENLTIKELKLRLQEEAQVVERIEQDEYNLVKNNFTGKYLKVSERDSLFGGKEVSLYYIKAIVEQNRTESWDLIYTIEGQVVKISNVFGIIHRELKNENLSLQELSEAEDVGVEGWGAYLEYVKEYDNLMKKALK